MGRVLEALRQLESKQGSSSSAGPTVPLFRQAVVADDDLAPPPEYLPDELALRQEPEFPLSAAEPSLSSGEETSVGSVVGRIGNPSSSEAHLLDGLPIRPTGKPAPILSPILRPEAPRTVPADDALPRGAYDELAETILAQIVPGHPAAFCFTSLEEDIGRTTMVALLAAALARRESQGVLAVDADFRRPSLGSHFGVPSDPGLAGVLCGRAAWEKAIGPTEIPSLFVLPAGRGEEEKGTVPICRNGPEGASHKWGLSPFPARRAAASRSTRAAAGAVAWPIPAGVGRRSCAEPAGSGFSGSAFPRHVPGLASGPDPQTGVASRLAGSGNRRRASPGKHPLGTAR